MELIEKKRREQGPLTWIVLQEISAAVKPVTMSSCKRVEIRIKRFLQRVAEWIYRVAE
jgi:hypothetical protein